MSPRSRAARFELLLAALLFSTGGTVIKALSLTSWQVVSTRSFVAAVVLIIGTGAWRGLSWRSLLVGCAQAATMTTFVVANKLTTAANAVFLQATAPLYIAALGPFLLGEHFKRRDLPLLFAIFGGILLLFVGSQEPLATAPNRLLGTLVGVVSGCCWSLTVMGLRWLGKRDPSGDGMSTGAAAIAGNLLACAAAAPFAFPFQTVHAPDVAGVAYLGVFQVGVAYLLLSRALRHVAAAQASLLLLIEPALSPVWAWLVHGEAPGLWPALGGALIIGAATMATWRESRVPVLE
jgi:drug/metabolite transporter (DMT)-like permease